MRKYSVSIGPLVVALIITLCALTPLLVRHCDDAARDVGLAQKKRRSSSMQCLWNMERLSRVMRQYSSHHETLPMQTGLAFWRQVLASYPLTENERRPSEFSALTCPCGSQVSYRGPARDANLLGNADIVACCPFASHLDGIVDTNIVVLMKNGEAVFAPIRSDLHEQAIRDTRD